MAGPGILLGLAFGTLWPWVCAAQTAPATQGAKDATRPRVMMRADAERVIALPKFRVVKQQVIARVPIDGTPNYWFIASADCSQVAVIDQWRVGSWYVALNSRVWDFYDEIDGESAQFSVDGHLWVLGRRDGQWRLVRDDQDVRLLGDFPSSGLTLSPDGKHEALLRKWPEAQFQVMADGKEMPGLWKTVSALVFSPDSQHLAYTASKGEERVLLLDGKELGHWKVKGSTEIVFSADSQSAALAVVREGEKPVAVIVNGKVTREFAAHEAGAKITALQMSEDGGHVLWAETGRNGTFVMFDGAPMSMPMEEVTQVAISADLQHTACIGRMNDRPGYWVLVADGRALVWPWLQSPTARVRFPQANHLRVERARDSVDAYCRNGTWELGQNISSEDGQLRVQMSIEHVQVNGEIIGNGTVMRAAGQGTGRAVVLAEERLPAYVNEKPLAAITRYELAAKEGK